MALAAGVRLGPYEIVSAIGAGGMGEVYRARDTRLKREVALKILPDSFASDPDRLARFQREAEVLASLNHPNIAAIYGVEHQPAEAGLHDSVRALVLELVEGETLADRIARGPIPIDEALPIAKQIAEALEAAHEHGVIHRDLKPANVKVRPDGAVKVLDFGLAKAMDAGGSAGSVSLSMSPTLTSPAATGLGVVLGTAAYMAPEQAKGRAVDKRADLWAFGCLLFEMLTGARAFAGDEIAETLAAVIRGEPDWHLLSSDTPPAIRRLLHRCLVKDPRNRLADAATARIELDDALAPLAAEGDATVPRRPSRRWFPYAAGAAVATLVALPVGWFVRTAPPVTAPPMRFTVELPRSMQLAGPARQRLAISQDGQRIAYVANQNGRAQLFVRPIGQLESVVVRGLEQGVGSIFFSPDGEWIGYNDTNTGAFRKVPVGGGASAQICEIPSATGGFRGATWGSRGQIVFATGAMPGLMQVPDAGGTPQPLTVVTTDGEIHRDPVFLPDGTRVVFLLQRPGEPDRIAVTSIDDPEPRVLLEGSSPQIASAGYLVFRREDALWAVGFNLTDATITGIPKPVLESVAGTGANQRAQYAMAANGTLLYTPAGAETRRTLVWVDRQGNEEPIPAPPHIYASARISPDGGRLALDLRDEENDIWVWDIRGETLTRITFDPGADENPVWASDGRRIAFASNRVTGLLNLYWRNADGTGSDERLTETTRAQRPTSFSPDGRSLLFHENGPGTLLDIFRIEPSAARKPSPLVQTPFLEGNAEVSPDGRWMAYQSRESGVDQVFVRPFPDVGSGRWQVSTDGGIEPVWSRDGRELFFVGLSDRAPSVLQGVVVNTSGGFSTTTPRTVLSTPYVSGLGQGRTYDVAPDGRRFLMIKAAENADTGPQIVVVLNWFEELKRLVPME